MRSNAFVSAARNSPAISSSAAVSSFCICECESSRSPALLTDIFFFSSFVICEDFELQSSITEVLWRMTTPSDRKDVAEIMFTDGILAHHFASITGQSFEQDSRTFLNSVNSRAKDNLRT
eukprot:Opistho-2@57922